jgi:S-disulfanyl-L-cysteine oxidoreductase SoxD
MPADRPGQLSREQNADILAFLLSSNGFPAGQKELPTDAPALQKIRFESVKPK